jgi:hypothetical protein
MWQSLSLSSTLVQLRKKGCREWREMPEVHMSASRGASVELGLALNPGDVGRMGR